jgi:hypothetical protein
MTDGSIAAFLKRSHRGALPHFRLRQAYGATGSEAVVTLNPE